MGGPHEAYQVWHVPQVVDGLAERRLLAGRVRSSPASSTRWSKDNETDAHAEG
jgi:hypothetical protein